MDQEVPLPNVSSKILAKVIEYCKYHVDADKTGEDGATAVKEEDSKAWDTEFVKVDQGTLFELILVRRAAARSPLVSEPFHRFASRTALGPRAERRPRDAQAANFLNIKQLLDLTCLTVANMIKGASPRPRAAALRTTSYRPAPRLAASPTAAHPSGRVALALAARESLSRAFQAPPLLRSVRADAAPLPTLLARRQDAGGDPQDLQHQERLHAGAPSQRLMRLFCLRRVCIVCIVH